jgi:hypothetical protein
VLLPSDAAQFAQNRAPAAFCALQRGQTSGAGAVNGAAQLEQKRAVSRFWLKPQEGQGGILHLRHPMNRHG